MNSISIGWLNCENFYNSETSPTRPPRLQSLVGAELTGWTESIRDRKASQLATALALLNGGAGADVVGLAEVEDEEVAALLAGLLSALTGRSYAVVHHDSPDTRGIDVVFLYDLAVVAPLSKRSYVVVRRNPSRDVFSVHWQTVDGEAQFYTVGNHWPARVPGKYLTEPFRILAAETAATVVENIYWREENNDPNAPEPAIVLLGDFNDEPFARSMGEHLLGTPDRDQVLRARLHRLLNVAWTRLTQDDPGTMWFDSEWYLFDQALVNRGLLAAGASVRYRHRSFRIVTDPSLMLHGRPRRFGRPSTALDEDGCSDHFPVELTLDVVD